MPVYATSHAPAAQLKTHQVTNQPGHFAPVNLYACDAAMRDGIKREAGEWLDQRMMALGGEMGSAEVLELGDLANRHPPELIGFDRYGHRLDEVRFHPAYHDLMARAMKHRIHDISWHEQTKGNDKGAHLGHFGLLATFTQAEAGTMCPINMTYAAVPALRQQPDITEDWLDKLIGGQYHSALAPLAEKRGVTIGMAMTEKQGGSDVRANSTRAYALDQNSRHYRLVGHKWFCSAPMCDAFLTLAYTEKGLSCFLVPRILPDGSRNSLHVMRLKDKLGNKSNASSEIEYHHTQCWLLGEEGRGINVIIEMVHHTRLGTVAGTIGIMRMALVQALHHISGRAAFQKKLIDQPIMRAVAADLVLEYEAAVALGIHIASIFGASDERGKGLARLGVALAKYWLTKRNPAFIYECMECHGGAGYVEESPMPRLFRESPLNGIWEGSGNVIALDILRTMAKEPGAIKSWQAEIDRARGTYGAYDRAADRVRDELADFKGEYRGRWLAENMALLLQASLLIRHAPAAIADGFVASRFGDAGARLFGTLPQGLDVDAILSRHLPH